MQEFEDGFLLSEVPLGEGHLDLERIIQVLTETRPDIQFNLEMITRDPLRVPCLREGYWATFSNLPARDLAGTWASVKRNGSQTPLPEVASRTAEERIAFEEENNRRSFQYAQAQLGL